MDGVSITLDLDWAPDAAIDFSAELLAASGVRATWFGTHASPAVDRLRERPDLFELGIHPNFLAGSSHGETPERVLATSMELVPEARSLVRVPTFWEDDVEFERDRPCWELPAVLDGAGLKVFDFHPIHIFLKTIR